MHSIYIVLSILFILICYMNTHYTALFIVTDYTKKKHYTFDYNIELDKIIE